MQANILLAKKSKYVGESVMTPEHSELWDRLSKYELGNPDSKTSFSSAIARKMKWPARLTEQAIVEYKKFVLLGTVYKGHIVPSQIVDERSQYLMRGMFD